MPRGEVRELEGDTFIRNRLFAGKQSAVTKYRELVVGERGWLALLWHELVTGVIGYIPGAAGIVLRRLFYRRLLGEMGKGAVIGRDVTFRHAHRISLGRGVVIDDHAIIDAHGADERGIRIGDQVIIGRNAALLAKKGHIHIGSGSNIGSSTMIISRGGVSIGESALLGGECHVSGGMYHMNALDQPIMHQGIYTRGPIEIGSGVWLGMKVGVLDAVRIGDGCVVGAASLVTRDLPDHTVATGVPAKVVRHRRDVAPASDGGALGEGRSANEADP